MFCQVAAAFFVLKNGFLAQLDILLFCFEGTVLQLERGYGRLNGHFALSLGGRVCFIENKDRGWNGRTSAWGETRSMEKKGDGVKQRAVWW